MGDSVTFKEKCLQCVWVKKNYEDEPCCDCENGEKEGLNDCYLQKPNEEKKHF